MWGMVQKDNDIDKSKEISREECAKQCEKNVDCIGFDFYPVNKDCFLSQTTWKELVPSGLSGRWVCEKKDGIPFFQFFFSDHLFVIRASEFEFERRLGVLNFFLDFKMSGSPRKYNSISECSYILPFLIFNRFERVAPFLGSPSIILRR